MKYGEWRIEQLKGGKMEVWKDGKIIQNGGDSLRVIDVE
jgi:hypothetical protein